MDRIVSESPTSSTEWSRHSIIFAEATVHFPNDDLDLLFRPKLLSSVRPRVFARECFFSIFTFRKISRASARSLADLSRVYLDRVCPRTVRASSRELFFAARENPLTWKAVNVHLKTRRWVQPWLKSRCTPPRIPILVRA